MAETQTNADVLPVVHDRGCGTCTLCCKVMSIGELGKAAGKWCPHVMQGKGCGIYADRPSSCAIFGCGWLHWKEAGDHWFPARSKMVIAAQGRTRLAVHVDPATPNAWKADPWHADLKRWARSPARYGFAQVLVAVGRRMIAILPDRDLDLGEVPGDAIVVTLALGEGRFTARVVGSDDPQFAALQAGLLAG